MHEVICKELAVLGLEPPQNCNPRGKAQDAAHDPGEEVRQRTDELRGRVNAPERRQGDQRLQEQHPDRVERRDHRPLAQPHQTPKRAGGNIGPGRTHQAQIGRRDRSGHGAAHNIRPDQNL